MDEVVKDQEVTEKKVKFVPVYRVNIDSGVREAVAGFKEYKLAEWFCLVGNWKNLKEKYEIGKE